MTRKYPTQIVSYLCDCLCFLHRFGTAPARRRYLQTALAVGKPVDEEPLFHQHESLYISFSPDSLETLAQALCISNMMIRFSQWSL